MGFPQQLEACLQGRACVVGLGNRDYGDDGVGVRLAEAMRQAGFTDVLLAETTPERLIGKIVDCFFDNVMFVDAVDFGATAGALAIMEAADMNSKYPQISTHKLALGTLAQLVEANGMTKAWLLGVQPARLRRGSELSPAVENTVNVLTQLMVERRRPSQQRAGADSR